jgi:hypothetical protein
MWGQLANAIAMRSSEDQVLWIIFGTFWAANLILLVAIFQTGDIPSNSLIGLLVAFIGILLSRVWHVIQNRALGHVERHEELMKRLESNLILESESRFAVSARINVADYDKYLPKGSSARKLMPQCSKWGIRFWVLGFIFFLWLILHNKFCIL